MEDHGWKKIMRLRGSVISLLLKATHSHQAVVQQIVHTTLKSEVLNACLYFLGLNVMGTETEMIECAFIIKFLQNYWATGYIKRNCSPAGASCCRHLHHLLTFVMKLFYKSLYHCNISIKTPGVHRSTHYSPERSKTKIFKANFYCQWAANYSTTWKSAAFTSE